MQPVTHRFARLARDLRLSAALLVIWLIPPAAHAQGPITAPEPEPAGRARGDDDEHRDAARTYIIHLPGIAGPMRFDSRFGEGLVVGQAGSEVEIFDWVGKRRGLRALYGIEENRRQARKLADRIIALKAKDPTRPLVITAHSGGTAVVAWALEMLGEEATERRSEEATKGTEAKGTSETSRDRQRAASESPADRNPPAARSSADSATRSANAREPSGTGGASSQGHQSSPLVDGVLFIASGLSSDYDLSPMLRQVRGRVFHLSSRHDNLILAAGTAVFGTLDGKNGLAAGKTGFYLPAGVAPEAYARLIEVPYDRAWAKYGHYGDHEGMMTTSFASAVAADLVRASLGVIVELPTTRPAQPAPVKPATSEAGTSPQPAPDAPGPVE